MISGTLPNNTVWWLSRDGQKIWIESRDLEQHKFKEKGYNIVHGRIFYKRKDVGELTTSRLDSRINKDAWIIKLEAILDIYPELIEDIERKKIEEKKKKKSAPIKEIKKVATKKIEIIEEYKKDVEEPRKDKEPVKDYFDINRPYVAYIKDEIDKNNGKLIISYKNLKEKMGEEFLNMHDIRIYLGLKKILSKIGIVVESISIKGKNIIIMKKIL